MHQVPSNGVKRSVRVEYDVEEAKPAAAPNQQRSACVVCRVRYVNDSEFCDDCTDFKPIEIWLQSPPPASAARGSENYDRFLVVHENGIKYMKCDQCSFICRPLVDVFSRHYSQHAADGVSQPDALDLEQLDAAILVKCTQCDASFADDAKLSAHYEIHATRRLACKVCNRTFATKIKLQVHKRKHSTKVTASAIKCGLCDKQFKTKSGYNHHRANVCVEYRCDLCQQMFLVKGLLSAHQRQEHGLDVPEEVAAKKARQSCVCSVCGKRINESALSRHMQLHTEQKPYQCDMCGKQFRIKWSLREHIMIEIGMKDYVCEVCGKKFVIQAYLNKHMRVHLMCDGKFEGFQCEMCGKKFAEEWRVKEHQRNTHRAEKARQYACDLCDRKFERKWLVRSHKRAAHEEFLEEYQCEHCAKKFTEKWMIKLHLQTLHGAQPLDRSAPTEPEAAAVAAASSHVAQKLLEYNKMIASAEGRAAKASALKKFECELCGKTFATKQGMKNHVYAELNMRKYVCEICGKRYNWWMGLKEHSIMTHGTKEFACRLCSKEFPTKKRFKDHMTVHSEERPYNCECGNAFKLKRYLKKHQKRCCSLKMERKPAVLLSVETSTSNHQPNDLKVCPSVTDSKLPEKLEPYLKLHRNGIKYMQCDLCQFICRPLSSLFTRHYTTHFASNPSSNPLLDCLQIPVPPEQLVSVSEETARRKVYQCQKCAKRFYTSDNYRRHMRSQHKPPFRCRLCSCTYRSKVAYLAHCQRHNRPKATFLCECGRQFRSKDGLAYHRRNTCLRNECQRYDRTLPTEQHVREEHQDASSSAQLRGDPSVRCVCFVCGKTVKEMNLGRHMLVHNEERPFVCDLCGKRFKFKGALREHIVTEMGMKDYVCEVCGRKFVKRCYLTKHSRQHQQRSSPERAFECDLCDAQFGDQNQLRVHRRQHTELACELCAKTFESPAQFQEHQLTELVCHLCHEMFASNERLRQHVTASHIMAQYRQMTGSTSSAVYPCELCGRKFTALVKFNEHAVAEVKCELCETTFDTYSALRQHVESVHNLLEYRKVAHLRWRSTTRAGADERPQRTEYTCSFCDKKLFYKRTLMLHERMHTGLKPYKCERCGKAFVSKPSLRAHLVAEMNLRKFACEHCPKRYNFQADLLAHLKQCHKKRQYSCHVCGREFGLLKCLNDHLTMHSSAKPFTCDQCNLSFRLRKFLVRHTRKYHQKADNHEMLTEVCSSPT